MPAKLLLRPTCVLAAVFALSAASIPAAARAEDPSAEAQANADPLGWELDHEAAVETPGFPDPFEGLNRQTLRFNQHLDRWLLTPLIRTYGFIVPNAGRRAVRRVFANLNCPSILVNDLLQREWNDARVTASRFAVNTTIGLAGILDPATKLGFLRHDSDFGQTLALVGVKSGPFIMLPALGPITTRDFFGLFIDALFRPTTYFLGPGVEIIYSGSYGFVAREGANDALQALEASSVDYYSALRNAYYQDRTAMIWHRREHHRPSLHGGPGPLRKVRRPWRSRPGVQFTI
jgi:phospholipid-binding lipoprotein MlaA